MDFLKTGQGRLEHQNRNIKDESERALKVGKTLASPSPGEEVVITGIAGCFPESDNVYQFRDNLLNKNDMVTSDNRRWETMHPEIPKRFGKINNIEKFDAGFFGIHQSQANIMDPMGRQLLEKVFEAIMDAGYNPQQLRGSRTGVFVGVFIREAEKPWFCSLKSPKFGITGCMSSLQAQRVSYFLGLNGPSYTIDSACSTSLYGLEHAYRAVRSGKCDSALVAGMNLCLNPLVTLEYARLGVLSPDGCCKSFDANANGYVRGEAVSVIYLQKSKDARRIYAQIVHTKTNCDGFKDESITYPSWFAQSQLFKEVCRESNVDPATIVFAEGHVPGTKAGDPAEIRAMDEIFCTGRKSPLYVGSIKSNIGHTEAAAGLCSVIKVLLGMENGCFLPNINYKRPPQGIKSLETGRMVVVTETLPFPDQEGQIASVSNFGFGGANANVLLKRFVKGKANNGQPKDDLPRLVCVSGRTKESVTSILNDVSKRALDAEFVRLLHEVFRSNIEGHSYRGCIVISKTGEMGRSIKWFDGNKRPLCLVFTDLNRSWLNTAKELLKIPLFMSILQRIDHILSPKGLQVRKIILEGKCQDISNTIIGTVALQVALVEILKALEIIPDYTFGNSVGELTGAYVDGVLTLEQVMWCSYFIGQYLAGTVSGSDYQLNIDMSETGSDLRKDCKIVGHNGKLIDSKQKDQVTAKFINKGHATSWTTNNSGVRYKCCKQKGLLQHFKEVIPKWATASAVEDLLVSEISVEYFINNLLCETLQSNSQFVIPSPAVVLQMDELKIYHDLENARVLPQAADNSESINSLLCALGQLYELGYNPKLDKLYPIVEWPVSTNTPMISPLIKWDHSTDWFVPSYQQERLKYGVRTITFNLKESEWAYMKGHNVDGHNLLPATGYLVVVWETFAIIKGLPMAEMAVVFENAKFHRATDIPNNGDVKLTIMVHKITGAFEVEELGQLVVSGRIYLSANFSEKIINLPIPKEETQIPLTHKDIYKELRLRGYYYGGLFCALKESNLSVSKGTIQWNKNWATFIDNMLQIKILQEDTRILYVPTCIERLKIDAKAHIQYIDSVGEDPLVPVYAYREADLITSGGIEIRGLSVSSIPRRKLQEQPILETYKFIPLEANLTTKQSVRVVAQILSENTYTTKIHVLEILDETTELQKIPLGVILRQAMDDQPLIQPNVVILSKIPLQISNATVRNNRLNEETDRYSLVVVSNVLHKPEMLKQTLAILKKDGMILSREDIGTTVHIAKSKFNLNVLTVHQTKNEKLILMRKSTSIQIHTLIDMTKCIKNFSWLSKLKSLIKNGQKVILYAQNKPLNGLLGFFNCLKHEPGGFNIKCVFLMDKAPKFDINNNFYIEQLNKDLSVNVFQDGKWGTYRHFLLEGADAVESEHIFNNVTVRGDLSTLRWIQGPLNHKSDLPPGKELVQVYYSALNFRDIMTASGKLGNDIITKDRLEQHNVQGCEYCGRTSSGKRVMGIVNTGALASMVEADSCLTWEVPNKWSMEDGVTIPIVYSTVMYCFIVIAKIKPGQSILIHSGTGGVGQAAINVALYYKCNIFTTVGTERKRKFITTQFPQIPESHIGNSRDTSFKETVMKETNGRGVDIVLNSLAEEKLQASISCLAKGGKFLEIGKFDMVKNSSLGFKALTESRSFHGVTIDAFFRKGSSIKQILQNLITDGIQTGCVKPLDRTVFEKNGVEKAFRYMASGQHIGKVVINIRREEPEKDYQQKLKLFKGISRFDCNSNNSYIIVGGLGGFGLELADWLITRGATKIILTSRHGLQNGYQASRKRIWESYGLFVKILTSDVTTKQGCVNIIQEASKYGPVEGIFNLAVVLRDGVLENQNKNNFIAALGPKAIATENLDVVSRELCTKLKYFVVFSSISCGRGISGQTNYAMANSVMERICEERVKNGYPALAIQWGAIGEVGLVAEMQEQIEIGGTKQQSIASCFDAMDTFLRLKEPIVSTMVLARKTNNMETTNDIVNTVKNIIGLNDLQTISFHSTLSELGMDSMMTVEINQTLKIKYDMLLTAKEIRRMTFKKLQEIAEERTRKNEKNNKNEETISQIFYQWLPFLGSEDNSSVPVTKLEMKKSATQNKVFLLPGIAGTINTFQTLVSNFEFHTSYLQYTNVDEDKINSTIEDVALSLLPDIEKNLSDTKSFTLIAYSYGCIVALHATSLLEEKGYRGNLILMDGSPALFKELIKEEINNVSESVLQTNVLGALLQLYVSPSIIRNHEKNLLRCTTFEDRANMMLSYIKKDTPRSEEFLKQTCAAIYKRMRSIVTYQPNFRKLNSTVKLLRSNHTLVENFSHDYMLQELCENPVEVITFEDNHLTILKNIEVSNTINKIVNAGCSI